MSVRVKSGTSKTVNLAPRILMNEVDDEGGAAGNGKGGKEGKAAGQQGSGDEPNEDEGGEGGEAGDGKGDESDESKWDEKTKAYVRKLRDENAKHRTKGKDLKSKLEQSEAQKKAILKAAGIEVENEDPAEKLKETQATTQTLAFRNAILESAVQNGIAGDQVEYYEFLVTKAVNGLEDGDELSDEALTEIVAKVRGGKGKANTGLGKEGKGGKAPGGQQTGEVTLDKFCRMSMMEKSKLYNDNEALYLELMKEAKSKKRLV